jgi:cytochrome c2
VCHPVSGERGQGPGLAGVVGRKSAATNFAYSAGLRSANLVWDAATLDRYLANPPALVPGTLMTAAVADAGEREELIAFLATLAPPKSPRPSPDDARKGEVAPR